MLPLIGAGIGAAGGILKSILGADKEKRDRQLAADTQRLSPWTGMQAGPIAQNDVMGNILQGGVGGAMQQQAFGNAGQGGPKFDVKTGMSLFDPQTGKPYTNPGV